MGNCCRAAHSDVRVDDMELDFHRKQKTDFVLNKKIFSVPQRFVVALKTTTIGIYFKCFFKI